jgi:hypothetical protein
MRTLKEIIELPGLADFTMIYATKNSECIFTAESKVVEESHPKAAFFAARGYVDQWNISTEEKIAKINQLYSEYEKSLQKQFDYE